MPSALDSIDEFITRAQRDRKYAPNTAAGMRAAVNVFAAAMNEDEKESVDILTSRLEQIYNEVFRRKGNTMSSDSLRTYYNRVKRVVEDFSNYNHDPDAYSKWSPQRRSHAPKVGAKKTKTTTAQLKSSAVGSASVEANIQVGANDRFEITFEGGQRALIILPSKRTSSDIAKVKKLVDFLEATTDIAEGITGENKRPSSV